MGRVQNPFFFLPDDSDNTKLSGRVSPSRLRRARGRHAGDAGGRGPCRRRNRRNGERPAGPALRQPQVGSGQCAVRPEQGPGRALGLYPRRHAGGDHRRIRELAAYPRLGRGGRLGLPLAFVRQTHRGSGADTEGRSGAAVRELGGRIRRGGPPAIRRARPAQILQRNVVRVQRQEFQRLDPAGAAVGRLSE